MHIRTINPRCDRKDFKVCANPIFLDKTKLNKIIIGIFFYNIMLT